MLLSGGRGSQQEERTMPRAKMIAYNGEIHSLSDWARMYNMSPQTLNGRLHNGMTFEEAINKPPDVGGSILYQGKFITYKELARLNGTITENGARSRIQAGWSPEKVVQTPSRQRMALAAEEDKPKKKPVKKVDKPKPKPKLKERYKKTCRDCKYRDKTGAETTCGYILVKRHSRPNPAPTKEHPECGAKVVGHPVRAQIVRNEVASWTYHGATRI